MVQTSVGIAGRLEASTQLDVFNHLVAHIYFSWGSHNNPHMLLCTI